MPFALLPDEKFAALVLRNTSTEYFAKRLELDLGNGLWVLNTSPMDVGNTWRQWIGSIRADEIATANFWIVAKKTSSTPSLLDQDNEDLKADVWHFFLALLLIGSPSYQAGYLITGAHVSGEVGVREFREPQHYLVSFGPKHLTIADDDLKRALPIRAGLRTIFLSKSHIRIRRGLGIFWEGLTKELPTERLHKFVRAVEAIVNPRIARTRADMINRCQTFTGRSVAAADILGECYDLRSREEHLWNWEDALPNTPSDKKGEVMVRRVRQAEALARHVYSHILVSSAHMTDFADTVIDGFWALPEHQRLARWGRLDMGNVP